MTNKLTYGATVLFSVLGLLLLVSNIIIISGNRAMQMQINERQDMIGKSVSLSRVNEVLVQALADASIKSNDAMIRELLESQGITIKAKSDAKDTKADTKASTDSKNTKK